MSEKGFIFKYLQPGVAMGKKKKIMSCLFWAQESKSTHCKCRVFLNVLDTDEIFKGAKKISFLNFSVMPIPISWGLLWRLGCLILPCWQRNKTSSKQIQCHPTPPWEQHFIFCCSLHQGWDFFFLLSLPTSARPIPAPWSFSTCCCKTAQTWKSRLFYQGQLLCHTQGCDLSPKTMNILQFSMPWYSLCWFHGLRGEQEVAWAAAPMVSSQHSIPKEHHCREHQHRALKITAETTCRCVLNTNRSFSSCQWRSGLWGCVGGSPHSAPAAQGSSMSLTWLSVRP